MTSGIRLFFALLALPVLAIAAAPAVAVPAEFRAIYLSFWSAGGTLRVNQLLALHRTANLNAVVIDVKDSTGTVGYNSRLPAVQKYHAQLAAIRNLDALLARLHEAGIYVIARIAVFEDSKLALARPDLAVRRRSSDAPWVDRKGLGWVDPGAKAAWEYNAAIAAEVLQRGFDEVNFDYVRFPSDGHLVDIRLPFSGPHPDRRAVLRSFFAYLRQRFPQQRISADLFGLVTVQHDDLGIGQVIEDAAPYFDYLCPMVYPSHFAHGFAGFERPAAHPYEVIHVSMTSARARLRDRPEAAKVRPWLQEFNLGAHYTPAMVQAQIRATKEALGPQYAGYLLWNPLNNYQAAAMLDTTPAPGKAGPPATAQAPAPAQGDAGPAGAARSGP